MTLLFSSLLVGITLLNACNQTDTSAKVTSINLGEKTGNEAPAKKHYRGAISNGMKGDSISFDISADGKKLENLIFKGYWRCSGRLEQTTVGPDGAFTIAGNKVNNHISEPPDGGSTAWRFDLAAEINGSSASGTFRMNINNLGCDTYKLNWTAKVVAAN